MQPPRRKAIDRLDHYSLPLYIQIKVLLRHMPAGTLLGGGGPMGSGGAIAQFVPEPAQRQRLFESVAYDCQINQQPSEAIEMFMAAQKPRAALKIINQQLSAAIHAQQGELMLLLVCYMVRQTSHLCNAATVYMLCSSMLCLEHSSRVCHGVKQEEDSSAQCTNLHATYYCRCTD